MKVGRNDPCPCGSGKKYKRCCWPAEREAESAALSAAHAAAVAEAEAEEEAIEALLAEDEQFEELSNSVIDLIKDGKIDEADQAAHELLERYPEVHDGYDRLGMVHEARGERKAAADCYRKVIEFVHAHPDQYDPEFTTAFERLIAKLDPPSPGSTLREGSACSSLNDRDQKPV